MSTWRMFDELCPANPWGETWPSADRHSGPGMLESRDAVPGRARLSVSFRTSLPGHIAGPACPVARRQ